MTYPPPAAAIDDYSSYTSHDISYLLPAAAGPAVPDPGAADEIRGGRQADRRSRLGRLLRRRRPPPQDGAEAVPGRPAAAGFAGASRHPEHTEDLAGPEARAAGYRRLHRAGHAEHHGISWSAARPGPAEVSSEQVNERLDPERAAQEHLSAFRPDAGPLTGATSPAGAPTG